MLLFIYFLSTLSSIFKETLAYAKMHFPFSHISPADLKDCLANLYGLVMPRKYDWIWATKIQECHRDDGRDADWLLMYDFYE